MAAGRPGVAGQLVSGYRRDAVLTQRELAHAAGVSIGVVRDLEQGRTGQLRPESAGRLARALGLGRREAAEFIGLTRGDAVGSAPSPDARLRIGVLGPLCVARGRVPLRLGGPMQRAVLGLLALHADITLPRAAIVDAIWSDGAPSTAVAMIHSYVSRLRSELEPGGAAHGSGPLVVTVGSGYRLQGTACDLDYAAFTTLAGRARDAHAAGDLSAACETYARALVLWVGDPLADVDALQGHPAVVRLGQERTDTVLAYTEAATAAGWPERALADLRGLTTREPFNERAHARLMIALARVGQQAAALTVYNELRCRLDDQLGVRPGAELADAQARVLRQDLNRSGAYAAGATVVAGQPKGERREQLPRADSGPASVPRQLPAGVPHFIGRAAELETLSGLLNHAAEAKTTVVVTAIGGTAGVGKTALVVQWAQQVAERFPDGQLYVNLRGYDQDQPIAPADALAGLLRALGVPGQEVPDRTDERAALYRSLLAGRRMLVVLDNAREADQVRPLLPGGPPSVALVTSRDSLAGLVARDGATRLSLDMLPAAEAVELLRALIGERVAAEPDAATMLADQCSRLPLALRLAAEFAVRRPGSMLAGLVGELADQQERLEVLDAGGDRRTALRTVFSWSYQDLPSDAARAFRLHGLDPCPAISLPAAAALIGTTPGRARRLLEQLVQAHLIQRAGPDRYTMHDLLRAYARQLSATDDRQEALTRLFDYYLRTAATAMNILFPTDSHRRPPISGASLSSSEMTSEAAARVWLDRELVNLLAVAVHAAGHGWSGHATRLAPTVFRHLLRSCYYAEAASIGRCAWQAAHDTGDLGAEATALYVLGTIDLHRRQYAQASAHLSQSLALFRRIGDRIGQAWALHNTGVVEFQQGRYPQAARNFQQALVRYQEAGERFSEARATSDLGLVCLRQGHYPQAIGHFHQAVTLARGTGDETCEAYAIGNLGDTCLRQGSYQQAVTHLEQAMAVFRRIGDPTGEAYTLNTLGDAYRLKGRGQEASRRYQQALELFRRISDRAGEAEALNGFGEALFATGHREHARAQHQSALGIASQIGDQNQQARAHAGLARTCHAADDQDLAVSHAREAATLYSSLGVPPPGEIEH